jgi:hypothetical protein
MDRHRIRLSLDIPADELARYYQGARRVVATAEDGRRVQFPASALQRFVTRAGVSGRFELHIDERGKLLEIRRLV